jgi:hypothetical protein
MYCQEHQDLDGGKVQSSRSLGEWIGSTQRRPAIPQVAQKTRATVAAIRPILGNSLLSPLLTGLSDDRSPNKTAAELYFVRNDIQPKCIPDGNRQDSFNNFIS